MYLLHAAGGGGMVPYWALLRVCFVMVSLRVARRPSARQPWFERAYDCYSPNMLAKFRWCRIKWIRQNQAQWLSYLTNEWNVSTTNLVCCWLVLECTGHSKLHHLDLRSRSYVATSGDCVGATWNVKARRLRMSFLEKEVLSMTAVCCANIRFALADTYALPYGILVRTHLSTYVRACYVANEYIGRFVHFRVYKTASSCFLNGPHDLHVATYT